MSEELRTSGIKTSIFPSIAFSFDLTNRANDDRLLQISFHSYSSLTFSLLSCCNISCSNWSAKTYPSISNGFRRLWRR